VTSPPAGEPDEDDVRSVLTVLDPGMLSTLQDEGRPGLAHLGVPPSGAMDRAAFRRANLLVGNAIGSACVESVLGGLVLRFDADSVVAVTGAQATLSSSDRRARPVLGRAVRIRAGNELKVGMAEQGVRTYVAVRGGLRPAGARKVLGSFSSDLLSGLGPPALTAGTRLSLAGVAVTTTMPDLAPAAPQWKSDPAVLPVLLGPREDELTPAALRRLFSATFRVSPDSNRVGLRLTGPPLTRRAQGELPSEGIVTGAVQLPPGGQPLIFGPDHPTTGGYPVVAVVRDRALDLLAQLRPGARVRFSQR
jgi:biotin-dependent carboxylase-like uncharacterized protein